jgi:hypothetical protein
VAQAAYPRVALPHRLKPLRKGANSPQQRPQNGRTGQIHSASRAGSPLLFGLAPRGVFHASGVAARAVGSYPTFSPLPKLAIRRRPAGLPAGCHRKEPGGLSFCGTFRGRIEPRRIPARSQTFPWRYQARRPNSCIPGRCPDFPPVCAILRWSDQRSPGPPANSYDIAKVRPHRGKS